MAAVCNICADSLFDSTGKQDISALLCGHTFHKDCLDEWCLIRKECPNCRLAWSNKIDKLYFEFASEENQELQDEMADLRSILQLQEKELKQMKEALETEMALKEVMAAELQRLSISLKKREEDIEELKVENKVVEKNVDDPENDRHNQTDEPNSVQLELQLTNLRKELANLKETNNGFRSDVIQLIKDTDDTFKSMQTVIGKIIPETVCAETERLNKKVWSGEAEIATLRKNLRNTLEQNEKHLCSPYQLYFPDPEY